MADDSNNRQTIEEIDNQIYEMFSITSDKKEKIEKYYKSLETT